MPRAGPSSELRILAHGIHPGILTGAGLEEALISYAATVTPSPKLTFDLSDDRLPAGTEAAVYAIVTGLIKGCPGSVGRDRPGRGSVRVFVDGVGGAPEHVLDASGRGRRLERPRPPGTGARPAMRVVVADDSLLTRAGIVSILREVGCDVVAEARDGVEALAAVRSTRPDVAVLDIRMPPTLHGRGSGRRPRDPGRLSPRRRSSSYRNTSSRRMRCGSSRRIRAVLVTC